VQQPESRQPEYARPSSSTFEIGQARQWQAGSTQPDYASASGPMAFGIPSMPRAAQTAPDKGSQTGAVPGPAARPPRESNESGALVSDIITRWFQQETIAAHERLNQAMQAQVEIQRRTLTDELREHVSSIQATTQDELLEKVEELIDARLSAGEARLRELISETRTNIASSEAQLQEMLAGFEERINQAIERGKAALAHSMSETQEKIRANLTSILLAELANKKNSMIAELGYELQSASKGAFREVLSTLNQVLSLAVDSIGTQPYEAEQSMSSASGQR
jgi:hypothetical protein